MPILFRKYTIIKEVSIADGNSDASTIAFANKVEINKN
jgi:hypothetical protein